MGKPSYENLKERIELLEKELDECRSIIPENEERFTYLADTMCDIIWTARPDGSLIYISPSVERLTGFTPEEAMHVNLEQLVTPEFFQSLNNLISGEMVKPADGWKPSYRFDLKLVCKNGQPVDVEVFASPVIKNNAVMCVHGVTRDISERKRILEALRESEGRYRLLAENASDVIWMMGLDLRFVYASQSVERLFGFTAQEIAGRPLRDLITPESLAEASNVLAEENLIETRNDRDISRTRVIEAEFICKNGSTVWTESTVTFQRDESNIPRAIIGITRDITERRIARIESETISKISRLFLSPASLHDLYRILSIVLMEQFNYPFAGVAEYDRETDEVLFVEYSSAGENEARIIRFPAGRSMVGTIARTGQPLIELDASGREDYAIPIFRNLNIKTFIGVPIIIQGNVFGSMFIADTSVRSEAPRVAQTIRIIADYLAREISRKEMENTLRETLEATTEGIWKYNLKSDTFYFSPRFYTMIGYEPGEFEPSLRSWLDLVHPEDIGGVHKKIEKLFKVQDYNFESEFRIRTKSGAYRWILSKGRVVERDDTGVIVRIIGTQDDITERKSTEERLKWQLAINMALAGLSGSIISHAFIISDIASIVFEYAKLLTDSTIGFVSEKMPGIGEHVIHARSRMGTGGAVDEDAVRAGTTANGEAEVSLWGYTFTAGRPFFSNQPPSRSGKTPSREGWTEIARCLMAPVMFNQEMVGLIVLANAPRDYTDEDLVTMRRFASLYAVGINRIRNEERLSKSLLEKEILIKELHHRVKNNLQVVSSLLSLQSRKIDDEKYRGYFTESQNRIHAMAMVHEKLYNSKDMTMVDFSRYIVELTHHLFYSYNINRQLISLNLDVKGIQLGLDAAVPCAMIINELVSNSLKHAFPNGRAGEISVSFAEIENRACVLTVHDTGIGFPAEVKDRRSDSLGMQIVQSLTKQMKGEVKIDGSSGTTVTVTFIPGGR